MEEEQAQEAPEEMIFERQISRYRHVAVDPLRLDESNIRYELGVDPYRQNNQDAQATVTTTVESTTFGNSMAILMEEHQSRVQAQLNTTTGIPVTRVEQEIATIEQQVAVMQAISEEIPPIVITPPIPEPPPLPPVRLLPLSRMFHNSDGSTISDYYYSSAGSCLSFENEYVPVLYLKDGELITSINSNSPSVFIYNLIVKQPICAPSITAINNYCKYIVGRNTDNSNTVYGDFKKFDIPVGEYRISNHYVGTNHFIACFGQTNRTIPQVLMCLAVRRDKVINLVKNGYREETVDKNDLVLLIDNSFIRDETHFKLYRNIKRSYIDNIKSFDVLYTNNLHALCFNEFRITPPRFRTILESQEYSQRITELVREQL